jgi:HIV-1 Vpr-binding protein
MILTNLLQAKTPPTDADVIRYLACRALNGLIRFEPVRQIISKLPIIVGNELNNLMKTPVLNEKRIEHHRFCEQVRQLIEQVCQAKLPQIVQGTTLDLTQEKIWKASIIADTRIHFNSKELLQLIYQHLVDIGFTQTAAQLQQESNLPSLPASRIPSTPSQLPEFVIFFVIQEKYQDIKIYHLASPKCRIIFTSGRKN